jgi:hypothetical protein
VKPVRMAAIVEGHGEVEAVPVLIQRIAAELVPPLFPRVEPVLRTAASQLRKEGVLESRVELAARKLEGRGGILILIDCDWSSDACPKYDAAPLLKRASRVRPDMPISVVLAYQEYEAWFLAAAESLRGQRGLPADLTPANWPESIRGAKEWLSHRMPRTKPYTETTDQVAFTRIFDMASARRADSFDKCYREITGLLNSLRVNAS